MPVLLSTVLATGTALLVLGAMFGSQSSNVEGVVQYLLSVLCAYALLIAAVLVASPLVRRYAHRGP